MAVKSFIVQAPNEKWATGKNEATISASFVQQN
jgi:hypothetical protein